MAMSLQPASEPAPRRRSCRRVSLRLRPPVGRSTAPAVILMPRRRPASHAIDETAGRLQAAGFFVVEVVEGLEGGEARDGVIASEFECLLDQLGRAPGVEGRRYGLIGVDEQASLALHLAAAHPDRIGALATVGLHDPVLALSGYAKDLAERITAQVYMTLDPAMDPADAVAHEQLKRAFRAADVWYECAKAGAGEPYPYWDGVVALMNCALKPWD